MNRTACHTHPLIMLRDVSKKYGGPLDPVVALRDINLDIDTGEFVAVIGKSGSGKSTLINLLTGIDSPTSGSIVVADKAIHTLNQEELARWRGRSVGIVFQFFQLLPTLTVVENIMLPMDFCNSFPPGERRERAMQLLADLGISDQANKPPAALSGGQQQRVAIARALANDPPLIVADEPTGNLDSHTAEEVMRFFAGLMKQDKTVVMVTHERDLQRYFARSVTLSDGVLVPVDTRL